MNISSTLKYWFNPISWESKVNPVGSLIRWKIHVRKHLCMYIYRPLCLCLRIYKVPNIVLVFRYRESSIDYKIKVSNRCNQLYIFIVYVTSHPTCTLHQYDKATVRGRTDRQHHCMNQMVTKTSSTGHPWWLASKGPKHAGWEVTHTIKIYNWLHLLETFIL
jgi:hypothetical protein